MTRGAVGVLAAAAVLTACASGGTAAPVPRTTSQNARASRPPLRVIGLGDSVMAGTNCGCAGMVEQYADALHARTGQPVQVENLGADGLVTGDVLTDLAADPRTHGLVARADVVVITIGANDLIPQLALRRSTGCDAPCFADPVRRMGANLGRVLQTVSRIRGGRTDHVLVTDYWNVFQDGAVELANGGPAELRWTTRITAAANRAICAAAGDQHAICVDLVVPFKGTADGDPTAQLADDGDHPNATGMRIIVRELMRATPPDL